MTHLNAAGRYIVYPLAVAMVCLLAGYADAGTYHVGPTQTYRTIQAGIDATTADDDVVLVHPGTYTGTGNTGLDVGPYEITIDGYGPGYTIIDLEDSNSRAFNINNGYVTIRDLAIKDAYLTGTKQGGAIRARNGSWVRLINVVITGCDVKEDGGAVYVTESDLVVIDSEISNNTAGDMGGGIAAFNKGFVRFSRSVLRDNKAKGGGGIWAKKKCHIEVHDESEIDSNSATGSGSGGGGIFVKGGTSTFSLRLSYIWSNVTNGDGGGVFVDGASGPVENCVVMDNAAGSQGGGLYVQGGGEFTKIWFCTVVENWSSAKGGALYVQGSSTKARAESTIFWGNLGIHDPINGSGYSAYQINVSANASPVPVKYCCIEDIGDQDLDYDTTDKNISSDPLFEEDGYHIDVDDSPCIDKGGPAPNGYYEWDTDIDGSPRRKGLETDIGADEVK